MKRYKIVATAAVTLSAGLLLAACGNSKSAEKQVSINYAAAASLKPALTELQKDYAKEHGNVKINFDFGGSGALREKVLAGAPIDGVFLASKADTMKLTDAKKATDAEPVLGNTLVLITNKNSKIVAKSNLNETLAEANKLAIGEAATVPAGKYATETMTKLGDLDSLKAKFVLGSDVTSVLNYVASGNADEGFVYQTDAMTNKNVKVLATVPAELHDKISYYTATVSGTKNAQTVKDFDNYLKSDAAQKVFVKYGFSAAK